ncbi:MAG: type II toxin-antitoxin system VapC family toxin [Candidatus Poribacteria bacterium]|nr:type II toxin-antitoxin system VapC family toxin [Candidatus Poribacteria bacterium]
MIYLVDTNILLGFSYPADPRYQIVRPTTRELLADGDQLKTTSQNIAEFWNVSTRPADRNGFGQTPLETNPLLQELERLFPLLPDSPEVYPTWKRLVVQYGVSGKEVHDARLVAAMIHHKVTHILTFNTTDFTRYAPEGIAAVNPVDA